MFSKGVRIKNGGLETKMENKKIFLLTPDPHGINDRRQSNPEAAPCRKIDLIVIHCSATWEDRDFTEYDMDTCHRRRGFKGTGYHYYIRKNGTVITTRPVERV